MHTRQRAFSQEESAGLKSLAYFHQFGAEIAEELVSLRECIQVFLRELSKSLLQEAFLLFKQPRHLCADLAYPTVIHFLSVTI